MNQTKSGLRRFRLGLVGRTSVVLILVAILPLVVATVGLRKANREAIREQVRRTHQVGVQAASARVGAYLQPRIEFLEALATNELLAEDIGSAEAAAVLRSTLGSLSSLVGIVARDADGEVILRVQWPDQANRIDRALATVVERPVELMPGLGDGAMPWLLFTSGRSNAGGSFAIIDDGRGLADVLHPEEIGSDAELALLGPFGEVVLASQSTRIAPELLALARGSRLQGAQAVTIQDQEVLGAWWHLANADWTVVSSQPLHTAEIVAADLDNRVLLATSVALTLAGLAIAIAFRTLIQPVRGILKAQLQLEGASDESEVSDFDQLRTSFTVLSERVSRREELGRVFLGRYQVLEVIGEGGMGTVFRGWDPRLQRLVALKTVVVREDMLDERARQLVKTLLQEAVSTARFNHPNIVSVYDVEDSQTAAYVAMEFVEGTTLGGHLGVHGHLDDEGVATLGAAMARALTTAHEHGLVHRDIKPANVLLGLDGSIKVTDFGLAAFLGALAQKDKSLFGSPGYIAPETVRGHGYSEVSDLFSLGVVLYESATGARPFSGATIHKTLMSTALQRPVPLLDAAPGLNLQLASIIQGLLAKDPGARLKPAAVVAHRLDALCRAHGWSWQGPQDRMAPPPLSVESKSQWLTTLEIDLESEEAS